MILIRIVFEMCFVLFMSEVLAIKFKTTIKSLDTLCLEEFITQSTPFHFRIEAATASVLTMLFKDGTVLVNNQQPSNLKKIDSYASVSSQFTFCIKNQGDVDTIFQIAFYQGLELADLSSLPKQSDAKIIDELVDRLNQLHQTIREQQVYSRTVNEYNSELQRMVSYKSVGLGFLSITVVLVIGCFHFLEIKRVLKNRKMI